MNKLSVAEICGMLEKQGMGQYAPDFHKKKVDGAALCKMERAHLIKLGVMNPAHQAALLQRIELYREDSKAGGFSGFGGFLHSAKAKVLAAASQCMASTQKGVAGCASLPQRGVAGCEEQGPPRPNILYRSAVRRLVEVNGLLHHWLIALGGGSAGRTKAT